MNKKVIEFIEEQLEDYWDRVPTQSELFYRPIDNSSFNLGYFRALEDVYDKIDLDE